MKHLFVTGMQRSGTTLLEKLLCNHPRISVLSQPMPLLFVALKLRFLKRMGAEEDRYPLGSLFLERRYTAADLHGFLRDEVVRAADLHPLFAEMATFSGQYTRFPRERLERALESLEEGDTAAVLAQLYAALAHQSGARWLGAKETLWEELLPHLLERGFTALAVLRDPRDVLASLNHGSGREHGGDLKPTLFNLRSWRKSVAFALHLEAHPAFRAVRYEDLLSDPERELARIAALLEVEAFPPGFFASEIRDQEGQPWRGNSSHGERRGIDPAAAGGHGERLCPDVVRYIEAACWPELRALGYPLGIAPDEVPDTLRDFVDPYEVERPELRRRYGEAGRAARAGEELRRWELLQRGRGAEIEAYFLFSDAFDRLHATLGR